MGVTAKSKKIKRNAVFIVLLLLFCFNPVSLIISQKDRFITRDYHQKYEFLKGFYYDSQYVQKKNPAIMPDDTLESFAGGIFLKGLNPILILHDQPPLGRYITSLSILVFDNANTNSLILLIASIVGIFLLGLQVLKQKILALIPMGLFINEPLFLTKFNFVPLLESTQLPFIIFALYFFIKGINSKTYTKWFLLTSLMLGFVISIRYFVLGFVLCLAMLTYLFYKDRVSKRSITFLAILPLSLVVLFASYTKTIMEGYSLWQVFGIQKYIFVYHKSKFILPFSFWDLLMFNRWHTWWGTMALSSDPQWIILWPVATVLSGINALWGILKKVQFSKEEGVLTLWVLGYCAMLSGGFTSTRYFLPLIPFLYVLGLSFVVKLYRK